MEVLTKEKESYMRTWKFTYWFEDGDWCVWEIEITKKEESIIKKSIEEGVLLDNVSELADLLERVYNDIIEEVIGDTDLEEDEVSEGLEVHFQDPNEPFYMIE